MKYIITTLVIILFSVSSFAHKGGHSNKEVWMIDNEPVIAEYVKYEKSKVFFVNSNHKLVSIDINRLSAKHKELVLKRYENAVEVNRPLDYNTASRTEMHYAYGIGLLAILILASIWFFIRKNKKSVIVTGLTTCALLILVACSNEDTLDDIDSDDDTEIVLGTPPANDLSFLTTLFDNFSNVTTSSDDDYFYISSNGLPNHNMMVGITAWNEQVPVNQGYTDDNSWSIPMQPVFSDSPLSTQTNFLKGAIAVAVNGIPIFNPLNNRGDDTSLIGELDQWGGHSGRADDYHYHLPPTHLQSTVGSSSPIAYALDGFPVYGETTEELDEYLGILNDDGSYQYHTIDAYPYFISAMRGEVTIDPSTAAPENQIIPQAFTVPIRSDLDGQPQTVSITNFEQTSTNNYSMTYTQNNETYVINYGWDDNGQYTFEFVNPDGTTTTQTYP
jgi:hypothetical protein